ncbi:hypothetical protein BST81_08120 [Leptolyngbya sp. 'hensonii']|uniref:PAS domain S-box protein n=1 Tax=Leptolyngbya sp. 'hensonii' TaxID=1922337 RepID=UPI00094F62B7|nr:PAS domain S-box protein [Leptolyngbya sp. 'hensonii']OLP18873.1 hypothetical protein BST81_08120 [Leptolyngbya sp. 'hensonii']
MRFTSTIALPQGEDLFAAIVHPLHTAAPADVVQDVIAQMHAGRMTCDRSRNVETESPLQQAQGQQSCVLVLEDNRLVGILTEQDLVSLSASGQNLAQGTISEVMSAPVLTLNVSDCTDLLVPITLFQRHAIRHLPLVDDQGAVVGLLTLDSLQPLLASIGLLRLSTISEVMTQTGAYAPSTATLAELAQFMATHHVSAVVIVEEGPQGSGISRQESHIPLIPIGIVTEGDIAQSLALELDFAAVQAHMIMSPPTVMVGPDHSLWDVQQLMQAQPVNQVVVTDETGGLLGLVTQATVLSVLHPTALYRRTEQLIQELQQQKDLLRAILDTTPNKVFIKDSDGRFLLVNRAAAEACHATVESMIGKRDAEFLSDPATIAQFLQENQAVIASQQPLFIPAEKLSFDGEEQWFQWQKHPITLPGDNTPAVLGIGVNITERKHAEQELQLLNQELEARVLERTAALQASEERWQLILRGTNDGIWDWDLTANKIFFSSRWKQMRGFTDDEIGDSPDECLSRIHPDDYDRVMAAVNEHFAGRAEFFEAEYRTQCKDGSYLWVLDRGQALRDESGQAVRISGSETDITQRKLAEDALRDSERRYATLAAAAPVAIFRFDTPFNCVYVNDRWSQMTGRTVESALGQGWMEALHPDDRDDLLAQWAEGYSRAISRSQILNCAEGRHRRPDGSINWYCVQVVPEIDATGAVLGYIGTLTDITDRKQAEAALQASEAELRSLFMAMDDVVVVLNRAGTYLKIAPNSPEKLYLPSDRLLGRNIQEIFSTKQTHQFLSTIRQTLETQQTQECEYSLLIQETEYWFSAKCSPLTDESVVWVARDISDRKRIEAQRREVELALQDSQHFVQQIADASPNILYLYDLQLDRNIYVNREIGIILGYNPEEVQAMGSNMFQALVHPDDLSRLRAYYAQIYAAQDGDILELEYRMHHANGEWRWLHSRDAVFSRDANGQVRQTIGTAQDITVRKRLEQEQNRLLAILEASTDYISIADLTGQIIWNNTALKQICGLESDAAVRQRHIQDYHPTWAIELILQQGLPLALSNGSWIGETALLDAAGQEIPLSQLILAHKSPQGEVEFLSTIARDMRVRKEYEQRLERTNAELLRATRLKDEFLANMSHELRTPLNAILGMSESLLEQVLGSLNDRQKKAIATIEHSGQHLLELITDILEVSKIAAGKLELDLSTVSVSHLCASSLVFIKQQAFKKQIQLNTTLPKNLGDITVDERRLRQVLINLLTNAVKFTPAGGRITLEAHLEPIEINLADRVPTNRADGFPEAWDEPRENHGLLQDYDLCISVIDTGIGISAADQTKLFQPFVQLDSSLNRQYEGTGLGLTLVKQIVELHGGSVSLTSTLGQGSCFTVRLPYNGPGMDIPSPTAPDPMAESGMKSGQPLILLAEDNETNISTLSNYLEAKGYRMILAGNGQEAIELARTHSPDLILMDIQMPKVDGLEAIQKIRQDSQLAAIPIIALTALAMTGDRERCLAVGASDYLAKPVKLKQLDDLIQLLLNLGDGTS